MSKLKLFIREIKLAFAICLASGVLMPVQAQVVQQPTFNSSKLLNSQLIFNTPPPPKDIGVPGGRTGGGSRGCVDMNSTPTPSKKKQLTSLVPVYQEKELVLGLTAAEHPTFWFYVPDSPPITGEFVLQDEVDETVYQASVTMQTRPGVVSVSLPSTASPLEIGKRYHWYFNINCNSQQPPIFVHGWIQRNSLNSTLKSQLEKATLQQRIAIYAANGFWFDALTASAELRRTDPHSNEWSTLLSAVGLDNIASEPIVECCKPGSR